MQLDVTNDNRNGLLWTEWFADQREFVRYFLINCLDQSIRKLTSIANRLYNSSVEHFNTNWSHVNQSIRNIRSINIAIHGFCAFVYYGVHNVCIIFIKVQKQFVKRITFVIMTHYGSIQDLKRLTGQYKEAEEKERGEERRETERERQKEIEGRGHESRSNSLFNLTFVEQDGDINNSTLHSPLHNNVDWSSTSTLDSETIYLVVSGRKFCISKSALLTFPETKLGQLASRHTEGCSGLEYVFDRNSKIVAAVLDLYRTGELHLPTNLCCISIRRELQ